LRWARHLLAIALLPFTVAVLVPFWLADRNGVALAIGHGAAHIAVQLLGVGVIAVGLVLFVSSLRRFAGEGEGTLAPWDPPRRLVVRGPYRYVRNPMISGVVLTLFGEALVLWSAAQLKWAVLFLATNLVYIPLFEEPRLRQRFGASYIKYCRHVPRVIPRLRPWTPNDVDAGL
jgi:protein-S-isoprenylcysteine O-methyltransferase Ste14